MEADQVEAQTRRYSRRWIVLLKLLAYRPEHPLVLLVALLLLSVAVCLLPHQPGKPLEWTPTPVCRQEG